MRVAVISEGYFPEVSGVTVAVAQHLRFLAARGHAVLLLHPRYPEAVAARAGAPPTDAAPRFQFHSDPIAPHREESRVPSPEGAAQVDAELRRFRPDAVVYHNPDRLVPELAKVWKPRRVAGLSAARACGALVVPIIHTLLPLFVERSGPLLFRSPPGAALTRRVWSGIYNHHFELVVTVDAAAAEYLASVGVRVPMLVGPYNGVDTSVFRPREAPRPRAPGEPLRICWIGRLVREKNAPLLPHLARALRGRGVPFELAVVGDGPLAPALRRELDAAGGASLTGWQPPERVAAELRASDLYLSLSDTESYSLTASEAVASGVPVVAPDAIGFRRLGGLGVGALFPASRLTPAGMREVAGVIADAAPRLGDWSRRAIELAPRLSWAAALEALYGDLDRRTGSGFLA